MSPTFRTALEFINFAVVIMTVCFFAVFVLLDLVGWCNLTRVDTRGVHSSTEAFNRPLDGGHVPPYTCGRKRLSLSFTSHLNLSVFVTEDIYYTPQKVLTSSQDVNTCKPLQPGAAVRHEDL